MKRFTGGRFDDVDYLGGTVGAPGDVSETIAAGRQGEVRRGALVREPVGHDCLGVSGGGVPDANAVIPRYRTESLAVPGIGKREDAALVSLQHLLDLAVLQSQQIDDVV